MRVIIDCEGSSSSNERGLMISKTAEQMWGVALLTLSPGYLIDKFLDWVEEFRGTMLPAYVDRLDEVRAEERLDPFNA
jgi:hypothetical protein